MNESTEDYYDSPPDGLVYVFHQDRLYSFDRAETKGYYLSYFGGPLDGKITGASFGPMPLHHIATISGSQVGADQGIWWIPLVYGMCYDGCNVSYEFSNSRVRIAEISPSKSEETWPYPNYPTLLPYFELHLVAEEPCEWARFEELFINQPEAQPADLIAVIPPPFGVGVSLWGRDGDQEGVELVFECDLKKKTIKATNKCT